MELWQLQQAQALPLELKIIKIGVPYRSIFADEEVA